MGKTCGMTTTPAAPAKSLLNAYVAAEIRAEMGRQGLGNADIARALGVSEAWTTRRLSRKSADTIINLADLERIAGTLNVPALQLVAAAARQAEGSDLKHGLGQVVRSAAKRHRVVGAPKPISRGRRDSTRPVSAIPANRRRPAIVGMGKRPIAGE